MEEADTKNFQSEIISCEKVKTQPSSSKMSPAPSGSRSRCELHSVLERIYAKTLDVLKVCMESMRKDAGLPFDLMVFDNGSCAEVRVF